MHVHDRNIKSVLLAGAAALVFCRFTVMQTGAVCMHVCRARACTMADYPSRCCSPCCDHATNIGHLLHAPQTTFHSSVTRCTAMNGCMQCTAEACIKSGCSSRSWSRLDASLAHSKGRMAASFAGGRLAVSSRPEAADKGPQAASRSLMVLLGDTPCNKSSWLPPPCIYIQACAIVSDSLAANHMACCLHWDATTASGVSCVLLEQAKVSEDLKD